MPLVASEKTSAMDKRYPGDQAVSHANSGPRLFELLTHVRSPACRVDIQRQESNAVQESCDRRSLPRPSSAGQKLEAINRGGC